MAGVFISGGIAAPRSITQVVNRIGEYWAKILDAMSDNRMGVKMRKEMRNGF